MAVIAGARPAGIEGEFARLLRRWRSKRRLSQLDLALVAGVSQRHLSFLESGRSSPSRNMILQLSESLDVPLRDRNEWLTAAGFAPVFKAPALDDPQLGYVLRAVRMMLKNHEPYPALAIDRAWNIRTANAPFERMAAILGAETWTRIGGDQRNLMRLLFHPAGLRPLITNWDAIAPLLWLRARREADLLGGDEMTRVLAELAPLQDERTLGLASDAALLPVMPIDVESGGVRLSLFTVIATFGTAQDVTTDELRIESLFPADAATEQFFKALAAGSPP